MPYGALLVAATKAFNYSLMLDHQLSVLSNTACSTPKYLKVNIHTDIKLRYQLYNSSNHCCTAAVLKTVAHRGLAGTQVLAVSDRLVAAICNAELDYVQHVVDHVRDDLKTWCSLGIRDQHAMLTRQH